MRRFAWGAAVVVGLAGCASSSDSATSRVTATSVAVTTGTPSATEAAGTNAPTITAPATAPPTTVAAAPNYAEPSAWMCRPDTNDVCDHELALTEVAPDGSQTAVASARHENPTVDCFYAYPTSSMDMTRNSDLDPEDEAAVAEVQAGPFNQVCDIYAPIYRSVTLLGFQTGEASRQGPNRDMTPEYLETWNLAYSDLRDAWEHYLATDNDGRGVILVGHSQGSVHLIRLLREVIDADAAQRSLLVGAFVPGASLAVPVGADVGGELQQIPLCRALDQTGCVVTFASFDALTPPAADSVFGHPWFEFDVPGMTAGCVNPAAPGGGSAALGSMFESAGWALADKRARVDTPLMDLPGLFSGECVARNGASYLEVSIHADPADPRADGPPGSSGGAQWGLHSVEVALTERSMVAMAAAQADAFVAAS